MYRLQIKLDKRIKINNNIIYNYFNYNANYISQISCRKNLKK